MLIRTLVAPLLGTNCHVVVDEAGRAVVVDPGGGVAPELRATVAAEGWTVLAVLATHGHVDHTWCAAELADAYGVALHLHRGDVYRLAAPFETLGPLGAALEQLAAQSGWGDGPPAVPHRVEPFDVGADGTVVLELGSPDAPFRVTALHAPGHTEGSTVYLVDAPGPTALTGDVLFAGSIGRTDLPGGDGDLMARSLARLSLLAPETAVLPGHGPASLVATELRTNPYLRPHR